MSEEKASPAAADTPAAVHGAELGEGRSLEQRCLLRLAPHLLGRARRGIVGSSRYAVRLREQVRRAAADAAAGAVLISGEPGLEKDNIAALIHFGSPARRQLLARVNCALLRSDGDELFGLHGDGLSLLDCLGGGSLLLDQIDRAPPDLLPALLELARTGLWRSPDQPEQARRFAGRVFLTAEAAVPGCEGFVTQIRVPPLRVRRKDLGEWLRYGVRQRARKLGWSPPPRLSEGLVKRLQTCDFPGNVRELTLLIERALRQCDGPERPVELPEDVFWTERRPQTLARFRDQGAGDLWPSQTLERWQSGAGPSADSHLRKYTIDLLAELSPPADHGDLMARGEAFIKPYEAVKRS